MDITEGYGVGGFESLNFADEFRRLVTTAMPPPEDTNNNTSSSFTALLEMPANQAMELLHFTDSSQARLAGDITHHHPFETSMNFPSTNSLLLDNNNNNVARFSGESNSGENLDIVKSEPTETDSSQNQNKRRNREKKVKSSMKKTKSSEEREKLPYVHVRARRGQATDNHSLAERARREKINARMKLLQELVPGCDKIQGTALVLDEIINHVQTLQRQVEMLSMRLSAVNPRIDFNLDSLLASENGSLMDGSFNIESYQQIQPYPFDSYHQPEYAREEDHHHHNHEANFLMGSATIHPNQVKMEL